MPNLGKTSAGSTSSASSTNKTITSKVTATEAGTVETGTAHIWLDSGTTAARFCVYADSAGAPGAKLAQSDDLTVSNTADAEVVFTFSGANRVGLTSGVDYHIGPTWQDPGAVNINFGRDGTATSRNEVNSYTPDPFGTPTAGTGPIAAYLTYSLPPGGDDGAFFDFF